MATKIIQGLKVRLKMEGLEISVVSVCHGEEEQMLILLSSVGS